MILQFQALSVSLTAYQFPVIIIKNIMGLDINIESKDHEATREFQYEKFPIYGCWIIRMKISSYSCVSQQWIMEK